MSSGQSGALPAAAVSFRKLLELTPRRVGHPGASQSLRFISVDWHRRESSPRVADEAGPCSARLDADRILIFASSRPSFI